MCLPIPGLLHWDLVAWFHQRTQLKETRHNWFNYYSHFHKDHGCLPHLFNKGAFFFFFFFFFLRGSKFWIMLFMPPVDRVWNKDSRSRSNFTENCQKIEHSWSISLCTNLFENQEHFTTQQVQICSFAPAISRLACRFQCFKRAGIMSQILKSATKSGPICCGLSLFCFLCIKIPHVPLKFYSGETAPKTKIEHDVLCTISKLSTCSFWKITWLSRFFYWSNMQNNVLIRNSRA